MDITSVVFQTEQTLPSEEKKAKVDVLHKAPVDRRSEFIVWKEPVTSGVLTKDGIENIANHKYVSGQYTYLENALNPWWRKLTTYLPASLAPNAITMIGLFFEILSYSATWYFGEEYSVVPSWVCFLNGSCLFVYYTLDAMDGKQARRTGSSSPLGQLFDHGVDCLCSIVHVSTMAANFMLGGSYWLMLAQGTLMLSFFLGQWEEYYTGVLEHTQGGWIGVTEVAYGMAVFSFLNAFLDRQATWMRPVSAVVPSFLEPHLPEPIASMEFRHYLLILWTLTCMGHVIVASRSVMRHQPNAKLASFSKLFCPLLLVLLPFTLPEDVMTHNARYVSLAMGLAFCMITIKIVVFGMAEMAYAAFQPDVLPFVLVCLWSKWDPRLTIMGSRLLLQLCCLVYAYRIITWTSTAIEQLCERLGIYCFSLETRKPKQL